MSDLFQERLKTEQPIVYQTLFHSLQKDKVAHAYLFSGFPGTPKKEAAYLLAQSLVCENRDVFACECCDTCRRIVEGNYADIIYINGKDKAILVDQVRHILEEFNKTGLEKYNKKIYIIDYVENCNDASLNALLKFLEEPSGDSVYAILITEQIDRILPTIVSRCQCIQFKAISAEVCYNICVKKGYDTFDAYLLSNMYRDVSMIQSIYEGSSYQNAKSIFMTFIEDLGVNKDDARLHLMQSLNFLPSVTYGKSETDKTRQTLQLFLKMNVIFFSDLFRPVPFEIEWYQTNLEKMKQTSFFSDRVIQLFREAENKLSPNESFNLPLVLDQLMYRL